MAGPGKDLRSCPPGAVRPLRGRALPSRGRGSFGPGTAKKLERYGCVVALQASSSRRTDERYFSIVEFYPKSRLLVFSFISIYLSRSDITLCVTSVFHASERTLRKSFLPYHRNHLNEPRHDVLHAEFRMRSRSIPTPAPGNIGPGWDAASRPHLLLSLPFPPLPLHLLPSLPRLNGVNTVSF
jgi:hypothetical protein